MYKMVEMEMGEEAVSFLVSGVRVIALIPLIPLIQLISIIPPLGPMKLDEVVLYPTVPGSIH